MDRPRGCQGSVDEALAAPRRRRHPEIVVPPDRRGIDLEDALVERVRGGDRKALELLLQRYEPRIRRICERILRDPEEARDVVQETLLAVARGLAGFRGGAALSTWVYAVARSYCIKRRRRSKFAPARDPTLAPDQLDALADPRARGPEERLSDRELAHGLERALAGLDPIDRAVVLSAAGEGLRAAEVAERLGLSVAAVKSRLHRARQALRVALASHRAAASVGAAAPAP